MSTEPEIPSPLLPAEPEGPGYAELPPAPVSHRARQIPNFGHTLLFLVITIGLLIITEIASYAFAMGLHLFGRETQDQLLREPRLLIPGMAISYLAAALITWAIFTNLWREPFGQGIHWRSSIVRRRWYVFLGIGALLSILLQFLSSYLPIPKSLPIDDFFRTPSDVWYVAIFGTFMAPAFEELAFRGFLFPSLASAWDWMMRLGTTGAGGDRPAEQDAARDPRWSFGALVFSSTVTSIGFAVLHADQLAHSWAPLSVLFVVSVVLCLIRLRFHSLAASTLVHASYNGTIFVLLFFATDGFRHLDKMN